MDREPSTIRATVRSLDGGEAIVEVEHGGCGRCHEKGGCGGQQLTQMFCNGQKTYRVENTLGAGVGDSVVVAIAAGHVRRVANLAYGLPLVAVILGAIAGSHFFGNAGAMAGVGLGLVLAYSYIRVRSVGGAEAPFERPHIISRS
jgi:sigma-E factor negative regulatory protein RseC